MVMPAFGESTFPARLLGAVDIFVVWWVVLVAMGLSILYQTRTLPIARWLFGAYAARRRGARVDAGFARRRLVVSKQEDRRRCAWRWSLIASAGGYAWWSRRSTAPTVTVETIRTRDLEAVVSASGKIQPKRFVNISADTSGRVVDLAVNEGDRVAARPVPDANRSANASHARRERPGGAAGQPSGARAGAARRRDRARAADRRAAESSSASRSCGSSSSRRARCSSAPRTTCRLAQSTLAEREKQVRAQEVRLGQDRAQLASAQFDLSKVRIESPIAGIVTRRNIQEGETAVVGTMNNAGTVLLTVADMSVIQAEVEVDETNIPNVSVGQTGQDHDRRDARSHVQGARDGNRQQPDSGDRPGGDQSAGDELQGRHRARRRRARRAAWVHHDCRDHDGHAQERRGRADSRGRRARADLRREGADREAAPRREGGGTPRPCRRAPAELEPGQTRKETEGRLRHPRWTRRRSCR